LNRPCINSPNRESNAGFSRNCLSALIVLSGNFDSVGGLQIYIRKFVDFVKISGLQVEVVHRPNIFAQKYISNKSLKHNSIAENLATLHQLLRYALTFFTFCLYGSLYCFKIVRKSQISLIHAQDTGYAGIVGLFVSKLNRIPLVLHVHGKLWAESSSNYSYYERTIGRLIAKNAAKIILVSKSLKLYYHGMGVDDDKMQVVSTGVEIASFSLSSSSNLVKSNEAQRELKVGYVGRLDPIKNVEGLIRGFAKATRRAHNRLSLVILGDGPDRDRLEEISQTIGVAVVFKGFTNNVASELRKIDIFVLPSFSEGCPLSLLEAMASGKAIIASDLPSIREVVRHNQEAILINPYDVAALEGALLLLSNDSTFRTRLGRNARERAKLFDRNAAYEQILRVYKALRTSRSYCFHEIPVS
jgi:glycosyltransferase involved in cell wall biosynthesis